MNECNKEPERVTDVEFNLSGKWGGEEDYSEQLAAAERIDEQFDFDCEWRYDPYEFRNAPSLIGVATVRGYWIEESSSESMNCEFVVLLDLNGEESITLNFPIEDEDTSHSVPNTRLKQFLKTCGVSSNTVKNIIGRKVYYKDFRTSDERLTLSRAFEFFNTKRTYISTQSQKVGMGIGSLGLSLLFLGLIHKLFFILGFSVLIAFLGIIFIDVVRRQLERHGLVGVPHYVVGR